MGTSSLIATLLDEEMLFGRAVNVFPPHTPIEAMPVRSGPAVSEELGGRYLLRYLLRDQYSLFNSGSALQHFTTPTPYSPAETVSCLALPNPASRDFVLFLGPAKIPAIRGPGRVRLGKGIEYILPNGFPKSALLLE